MELNLCYPTLSRYDLLAESISSALKGTLKPTSINIVDNGGKFTENFGDDKEIEGIPLRVYVPGLNIGCSRSWNYMIAQNDDQIVICNDDTIMKENTLELLSKAFNENPNEVLFAPECYWQHIFSFFSMRKRLWAELGEFDNNMFAHFSDRDMLYKMKLKGYKHFIVKDCSYTHVEGGSNSSKTSNGPKIGEIYKETHDYYLKKWCGIPSEEKYTKPFDILSV